MVVNIGTLADSVSLVFTEAIEVPPEYGLTADRVELGVRAVLSNEGGEFALCGSAEADLPAFCAKCLRPVDSRCVFELDERYVREPDGDGDSWPLGGDELDLTPALRSCLLLAIPVRVLCSDDCCGLCPVCGGDLNAVDCGCAADVYDSRFEILNTMFEQNKEV